MSEAEGVGIGMLLLGAESDPPPSFVLVPGSARAESGNIGRGRDRVLSRRVAPRFYATGLKACPNPCARDFHPAFACRFGVTTWAWMMVSAMRMSRSASKPLGRKT